MAGKHKVGYITNNHGRSNNRVHIRVRNTGVAQEYKITIRVQHSKLSLIDFNCLNYLGN